MSGAGTHASSLCRRVRVRVALERAAAEPAQQRSLLLGDAAGEQREREEQEDRADGRLPRGLELR